jgi:hypothetical protein
VNGTGDADLWFATLGAGSTFVDGVSEAATVANMKKEEHYDSYNTDVLIGSTGNDTIHAGNGNDLVLGGDGDDAINGGTGDDVVIGGVGSDTLNGQDGNDTIVGGEGADTVTGGAGNDKLAGNAGDDDTIFGGAGDDTFIVAPGDGADMITDFMAGAGSSDKIDLRARTSIAFFPQLLALASQAGADTVFDFGNGDTLRLVNVDKSVLTADDFLLAPNRAPTIISSGGNTSATLLMAENGVAAVTVTANDPQTSTVLSYSISGGADQARFQINLSTGALAFLAAPNFEAPADSDGNNTYVVQVQVSDGELTDTQTITVRVTDANDIAPMIATAASQSVAENSTIAAALVSTDVDTVGVNPAFFSVVGGGDAAKFNVVNGNLVFATAPDFDAPTDSDHDNIYVVQVRASDGVNLTDRTITINVTDVNDVAPVISTAASQIVVENISFVATLASTDPDTVGTNPALFSIVGGSDAAKFEIANGNLLFAAAPDFDNPTDSDHSNVYVVQVRASDGVNVTDQTITVEVTDIVPTIWGDNSNNTLSGTSENDAIFGFAGNDSLSGGAGNDLLVGGANTIAPALGGLPAQAGSMGAEWHVVAVADFNGDGRDDIAWHKVGHIGLWLMIGGTLANNGAGLTQGSMGAEWHAVGHGDFNSDGRADVVWDRGAGDLAIWLLDGFLLVDTNLPPGSMGAEWHIVGVGDFGGDGKSDVLWHSDNGQVAVWTMNGLVLSGAAVSNATIGADWHVAAIGDFDGNGRDDVFWQRNNGDLRFWSMEGASASVATAGNTGWHAHGVGDFNMDGTSDIVWVDGANNVQLWLMQGGQLGQLIVPDGHTGTAWQLTGLGDFSGDGRSDLLWVMNGQTSVWDMRGDGDVLSGGPGSDTFRFNALNEVGKVITDFQGGAGGDVLDLDNLLAFTGYTGANALQDGVVRLVQNGASTEVQVDAHPGTHHWVTAVTLQNVTATAVIPENFVL